MYAPIYWPAPSPVPAAVLAEEAAIVRAEGHLTVDGRYYAAEADARQARRWVAEWRVREAERRAEGAGGPVAYGESASSFRLVTWLTPRERQRIDAATVEHVQVIHRDSLASVGCDLARGAADGALISAARFGSEDGAAIAALVRGFPAHAIVGLVDELGERGALSASLRMGQLGIRSLVDLRCPQGWRDFRCAFQSEGQPDQFIRRALVSVLGEIGNAEGCDPEGRNQFFRLTFSRHIASAKDLSACLGVRPSTLMSRFFRAGLPSPKRYVAYARLVWAAHLGESSGMSLGAIANRLNASSPQSFHRTVRTMMGTSAAQFRRTFTGARMLERYREQLVTPYRNELRTFNPLADASGAVPSARAPRTTGGSEHGAEQGRAA